MLKGVNLGGWLVLERWITPSVFDGLQAWDETAFCRELGDEKFERLEKHRQNFITQKDFEWIAKKGINCVRVPVPHWLFGQLEPYVACEQYLDKAFDWANQTGLKIIIDVHTAPGSQNGYKHSGIEGKIEWHKNPKNIATSLEVLEKLARRYGSKAALAGIELLNEPSFRIPRFDLGNYYETGYKIVRENCSEEVAVIISDSFKPHDFTDELTGGKYKNTILDSHMYQCFAREDRNLTLNEHLDKTKEDWSSLIDEVQNMRPMIVGEWSLALPERAVAGLGKEDRFDAFRLYGQAQLEVFDKAAGWFYWTYKTENQNAWNFRHCAETGLLPEKF